MCCVSFNQDTVDLLHLNSTWVRLASPFYHVLRICFILSLIQNKEHFKLKIYNFVILTVFTRDCLFIYKRNKYLQVLYFNS